MKLTVVLFITFLSVCAADPVPWDWFDNAVKDTGNMINTAAQNTKDSVIKVVDDSGKWLNKAKEDTAQWIDNNIKDTESWFSDILAKVIEFYNRYIKPVIKDLEEIFHAVKDAAKFVVEKIGEGFNATHRQEIRERITQVFELIISKADKYIYGSLNKVEEYILKKLGDLGNLARKIADEFTSQISTECKQTINTDIRNYENAFTPKLMICIVEAKKELEDVYKIIKGIVLSAPDTVMDVIEVISQCIETMRKDDWMDKSGCLKNVGQEVLSAGTSFVMDIISLKILVMNAVRKVASSSTCVKKAAKSLTEEKKILTGHLKNCGMEFALDYLM